MTHPKPGQSRLVFLLKKNKGATRRAIYNGGFQINYRWGYHSKDTWRSFLEVQMGNKQKIYRTRELDFALTIPEYARKIVEIEVQKAHKYFFELGCDFPRLFNCFYLKGEVDNPLQHEIYWGKM